MKLVIRHTPLSSQQIFCVFPSSLPLSSFVFLYYSQLFSPVIPSDIWCFQLSVFFLAYFLRHLVFCIFSVIFLSIFFFNLMSYSQLLVMFSSFLAPLSSNQITCISFFHFFPVTCHVFYFLSFFPLSSHQIICISFSFSQLFVMFSLFSISFLCHPFRLFVFF